MYSSLLIIAPLLIAFVTVSFMHPKLVKIAILKNIVDKPNARKLQKQPVPILGGVLVFFGICLSIACVYFLCDCSSLFMVFAAMMLMLYIGTMDDILDLKPSTRFFMQILSVCLLIFSGDYGLDNLHGFWGVYALPQMVMILLTIFACVGIINALNLIDGVDGLSSGYCIMASVAFGIVFILGNTNYPMTILAAATVGALIPFFMHNVFGDRSKMFIGDGGTLLMGVIMSAFVMKTIQSVGVTRVLVGGGYSSVAFTLAVLSIPVFDTLRVIISRSIRHKSPFHPDKTHLHHLFLELGHSHIMTTILILSLNTAIILLWWLMGAMGLSTDMQVYMVALAGILCTTGVYEGTKLLQCHCPAAFLRLVAFNHRIRPAREGFFLALRKWVDKPL